MHGAHETKNVSEMANGERKFGNEASRLKLRHADRWGENARDNEGSVSCKSLTRVTVAVSEDEQRACWEEESRFWAECRRGARRTPGTHWRLVCTEPQTDRSAVCLVSIFPRLVLLGARRNILRSFGDNLAVR